MLINREGVLHAQILGIMFTVRNITRMKRTVAQVEDKGLLGIILFLVAGGKTRRIGIGQISL